MAKQARCALSSTPVIVERADGVHRSWTRIIYEGVDGVERENLCCKIVEIDKEVDVRNPIARSRGQTLWTARYGKDGGGR